MPTDTQKAQFLQKVKELMTSLGQLDDNIRSLSAIYVSRGYDAAGADPIIQTHLDAFGVVPADVVSMVTVVTQMANFFNGVAVPASAAYKTTINKWRQV